MDFYVWWALIVAFSLLMYAVLDGADLGVGALLLSESEPEYRDETMHIVATVWDGNETWLILAGVALFGGFPLAYGTLLPALYLPLVFMLFALMMRGVSFEVNAQDGGYQRTSAYLFALGSIIAAFMQGVILGTFLQGVPVTDGAFSGGAFDFFTPFSVLMGVLLVGLYGVLAAGWLHNRTASGASQRRVSRRGQLLAFAVVPLLAVMVAFTVRLPVLAEAWRDALLWGTLAAGGASLLLCAWLLRRPNGVAPYVSAVVATVVVLGGFVLSTYPYIVPGSLTLQEAASPTKTQNFLMYGVATVIPLILVYNVFTHRVFRGTNSPAQPQNRARQAQGQRQGQVQNQARGRGKNG